MKKLLMLAAVAVSVVMVAGCSCSKYNTYDNTVTTVRYNPNPVCPPPAVPCPPVINSCTPPPPLAIAPQPACPLPNNACAPVAPIAPLPQAPVVSTVLPQQPFAPGRVTYMEPVQVSGANSVQYYNPYAVAGAAPRLY